MQHFRVAFAITVLFFLNSFGFRNEPDGFRSIKWGTDISTLKGMRHIRTDPSYGGVEVYVRKGDELKIGAAKLEGIEYGFWKGKFGNVLITTKGFTNWTNLKEATFTKFGEGYKPNQYIEQYFWGDSSSKAQIALVYNQITEIGTLFMGSTEIANQQKEYEGQKAKEGSEKGF